MDMIIYLLLISVALIYWFQLSIYSKNNSSNKTKKYFNKIKLPIIVFCLLVIVSEVCSFNKKAVINNNNLEVFTANANF